MTEDPRCCASGTPRLGEARTAAMTRRRLGVAVLAGLILPVAAVAAGAAPLTESDKRAVRQVIEAQLQALAAGDAARAYSYASPEIQARFGDADNFMAMVRGGYPMVIRPAAVSFFLPQPEAGTPASVKQRVRLRDREGRLWIATYLLQRQAGAGWRIGGCAVAADSEMSST